MGKVIVISGPPRSGKSCFREGLKQALTAKGLYPFVLTACPDGEGAWFQATVERDATVAAACKAAYKSHFTPEFVQRVAKSVSGCKKSMPLTLLDIGGIPSAENRIICAEADGAIILSGDPSKVAEWEKFWDEVGVPVLGVVHSDYNGTADVVPEVTNGAWAGSVHHLERGEPCAERPTIKWVASALTSL